MDGKMIFLGEVIFPTKVPLKMERYVFTSISKIPRTSTTLIKKKLRQIFQIYELCWKKPKILGYLGWVLQTELGNVRGKLWHS
jgi:hypothetical protein